jgi:chorismate mutase
VRLQALRGAISCDRDSVEEVERRTQELVAAMVERNGVDHDDIVSVIFTATEDLVSEFPAKAARGIGLGDVPLICARELAIEGSMPRVIRVLMHLYTDRPRAELQHVYLGAARSLRDDIAG